MSTEAVGGTIESGGFTITSSHETAEQMEIALAEPGSEKHEADDPSKAAAILGKKGGEAAAEKRKAEAKEKARDEKRAARAVESADESPDSGDSGDAGEPAVAAKPDEKPLGKPRDDPRARMLEATRKEAEAKREAAAERQRREAAERRLAELEARSTKPEEQPQPAKQVSDGEPREEDFDSYKDYLKALARHEVQQDRRVAAEREREEAQHRSIMTRLSKFTESMTKAAEADPTFIERTEAISRACRPSDTMAEDDPRRNHPRTWIADELVHNPESAPALALYLQEHPDEFQRIATLPRRADVIRELAKLTRYEAAAPEPEPKPKPTVSNARPPVKPITGAPATGGEPGEDASYDEHRAYYNAREKRR